MNYAGKMPGKSKSWHRCDQLFKFILRKCAHGFGPNATSKGRKSRFLSRFSIRCFENNKGVVLAHQNQKTFHFGSKSLKTLLQSIETSRTFLQVPYTPCF